jgi:hypothetical protein
VSLPAAGRGSGRVGGTCRLATRQDPGRESPGRLKLDVSTDDGLILWQLLDRLEKHGTLGELDPAERGALTHALGALERSDLVARVRPDRLGAVP